MTQLANAKVWTAKGSDFPEAVRTTAEKSKNATTCKQASPTAVTSQTQVLLPLTGFPLVRSH